MKTPSLRTAALALSLSATAPWAHAGLLGALPNGAEKSPYIVQLNPDAIGTRTLNAVVQTVLAAVGAEAPFLQYQHVFPGFAVALTDRQLARLQALPQVLSVEADQLMQGDATQVNPVYGLDRVDEAHLPMDGELSYPNNAGAGVHVYVLDSGINPEHSEFTGRIGSSRNFVNDGPLGFSPHSALEVVWNLLGYAPDPDNWTDCHGHGTHVAGTAAGTQYGLAKQATIHAVRVLGCGNNGSYSGILAGMDWVIENAEYPAVANLSLGGANTDVLHVAIRSMYQANILPVVAAMNDNADACSGSPSGAPEAITVGATDSADNESSFSNHGTCVDIFAPGTDIESASHSDNSGSALMSGTSMASPHVAGAAALLLGETPTLTAADVGAALIANATSGVISLSPTDVGSPNLLLNVAPEALKQ